MEQIPSLIYFNNNITLLCHYLKNKGYPKWEFLDDLNVTIIKNSVKNKALKELVRVGGKLDIFDDVPLNGEQFDDNQFKSLEYVGGDLDGYSIEISILPNLKHVGRNLTLGGSTIELLPKLEYVGGALFLYDSYIEEIPKLKFVGGDFEAYDMYGIEELPNLEHVQGNLVLGQTNIKLLPKLKFVGGDLIIDGTPMAKKYTDDEIRKTTDVRGKILR